VASKNVALAEDAYNLLARQKRPGESFSDVVRRIAGRPNPMDYVGAWSDMTDAEAARMKRDVKRWRASSDAKLRRKLGRRGR
jgi:predicted CopG family antitoxin